MRTVSDIIYSFGGPAAFGRFFDVSKSTVNTWKRRNFFPADRDVELVTEAQRRQIDLSYEHLAKMRSDEAAA
ncbi:helix-turn-helix domain-containing protein [Phaeobacter sp. JH20_02]|uniref:helix-turn-helix domain-containing protein n=1 Tax=unclassified Phaeobacter TaxID=2621772 RepID=UPI003A849F10